MSNESKCVAASNNTVVSGADFVAQSAGADTVASERLPLAETVSPSVLLISLLHFHFSLESNAIEMMSLLSILDVSKSIYRTEIRCALFSGSTNYYLR